METKVKDDCYVGGCETNYLNRRFCFIEMPDCLWIIKRWLKYYTMFMCVKTTRNLIMMRTDVSSIYCSSYKLGQSNVKKFKKKIILVSHDIKYSLVTRIDDEGKINSFHKF